MRGVAYTIDPAKYEHDKIVQGVAETTVPAKLNHDKTGGGSTELIDRVAAEDRTPWDDHQQKENAAMVIKMYDGDLPPDIVAAAIKDKTTKF